MGEHFVILGRLSSGSSTALMQLYDCEQVTECIWVLANQLVMEESNAGCLQQQGWCENRNTKNMDVFTMLENSVAKLGGSMPLQYFF